MRRALWFGAFLLLSSAVGVSCKESAPDDGNGTETPTAEGGTGPGGGDGGTGDESGSGTSTPPDTVAPTFAGIKSATALSESEIGVTWDPASDDKTPAATIAYRVYIATTSGAQDFSAPVLTTPAGATGATITALHAATPYFIVVRAFDAAGNHDDNTKEGTAATTDNEAPTFAGVKTVTGTDAHDILVTWDAASDNGSAAADIKYEIYASTTPGGENFAQATATTPAGATQATVTGLPEATNIFVVVRAIDANGNKDQNHHEASGTTLDKTPPTFAGLTKATANGTTINLEWADASDNVSDKTTIKYDVFRAKTAGGEDFGAAVNVGGCTSPDAGPSSVCHYATVEGATSLAVPNLEVSTTYYFVVRAQDNAGNMDSNLVEKSATTAASPDVTPPTFAGISSVTATTDQTLDLAWAPATDDYSPANQIVYDIYMAQSAGGEDLVSPPLYTTAPGANGFTVTNLLPTTKYYFVVRARDQAGNQNKNNVEKNGTTFADTIPPTFAGLGNATALSPTSIQLTWSAATDDISGAAKISYRVYRSTTPGGEPFGSPLLTIPAGTTQATVIGLSPQTTYYFVVRAVDEFNNEDLNTVEKSDATFADTTAPTFAGATSFTSLSPTSATVSWSAATDNVTPSAQIVYLPYLATSAGGENFLVAPTPTAPNASNYTFNGLTPNTAYYVVVRAKDAYGNIDQNTTERTVTTQGDSTAPTFGGAGSVVTLSDTSLRVTWSAATDNVTPAANLTYLVCRTTVAGGCNGASFTATATVPNGGLNTTFTGLAPNTTYYFVVRAKDAFNNTDTNSNQVFGATLADTVAPTFAGLVNATSAGPTSIDLTWSAGSDDVTPSGQLVYDVYQAVASTGENYSGATFSTAAGATSYHVAGLLPGQKFYYVVRARDQAGNHDTNVVEKSATVQSDSTAPTFGGVTNVTTTGLTSLHASWNAASDNVSPAGSIVYYVCWSQGTACTTSFSAMATTAAGALSYDITGLLANTTYNVVVRAHDQYGNTDGNTTSIAKATAADTTAPNSPSPPQVTGASATSLTLTWPLATDNYYAQSTLDYMICMTQVNGGCNNASFVATRTLTNQTTTTFTGLTNLQTYYFVVRAKDPAGNIDVNNDQVSGQTVTDTTPPTFAGATSATQTGDSSILLQWSAATDNVSTAGQIVYDIYQASSTGTESYASPTYSSAAGATSYPVTGLTPNTSYYFVVRARDTAGNRDTNVVERTAKTALDTVKPVFAGIVGLNQISDSQLQATWAAASDDTTAAANISYQVCWNTNPTACTSSFSAMATTAPGALSYTTAVKALIPSTAYTFVVRAVDAYANVDVNTATATQSTLADNVVPTFAGAANVTGVDYNSATVNWAVATDDYTSTANMRYAICKTTSNGGCNDGLFVAFTTVTNQTSYTFNNNLTPNTQYYFVVRAEDQANNFNTTNNNVQVQAVTNQEPNPPTFGGVTSNVPQSPTSIQLQWQAATDDYSSATQITYNVYSSTTSHTQNFSSPLAQNIVGAAGTNTYAVSLLSPGTQYCIVVRAKDAAGNQESNTTELCATTPPTAPTFGTQPHTTGTSTSSVDIAWAASSTPATTINYQVCFTTTPGACNNFGSGTSVGTATTYSYSASPNTTYYYVVKATNVTGSTYSLQGSGTTPPAPPTITGSPVCGPNNYWQSYLYVTPPTASAGSYPIAGYDICYGTGLFSCGVVSGVWSNIATASTSISNQWIGAPSNPPGGSVVNGPPLTSNTNYYVRYRARDTQGNQSGTSGYALCRTPVSYSRDVAPIFSGTCGVGGCHDGASGLPGPWSKTYFNNHPTGTTYCGAGNNYLDTTTPANSYLYRKLNNGPAICGSQMPLGNPGYGKDIILNWITDGAQGAN